MNVHIEPGPSMPTSRRSIRASPIGRLCLQRLFSPDRKQTSDRRDTLRNMPRVRESDTAGTQERPRTRHSRVPHDAPFQAIFFPTVYNYAIKNFVENFYVVA